MATDAAAAAAETAGTGTGDADVAGEAVARTVAASKFAGLIKQRLAEDGTARAAQYVEQPDVLLPEEETESGEARERTRERMRKIAAMGAVGMGTTGVGVGIRDLGLAVSKAAARDGDAGKISVKDVAAKADSMQHHPVPEPVAVPVTERRGSTIAVERRVSTVTATTVGSPKQISTTATLASGSTVAMERRTSSVGSSGSAPLANSTPTPPPTSPRITPEVHAPPAPAPTSPSRIVARTVAPLSPAANKPAPAPSSATGISTGVSVRAMLNKAEARNASTAAANVSKSSGPAWSKPAPAPTPVPTPAAPASAAPPTPTPTAPADPNRKYTLAQLQAKDVPAGVDPLRKEDFLIEADFVKALGVGIAEWAAMPDWKKKQKRQAAKLF